jgi:transposase
VIAPTREELIRLRENMEMTREDIAEHFGVGVSTVRRWIREMKIPRPTPRRRKRHQPHLLMERAKMQLGGRLTESPKKGYMLDGRPSHVRLIIAAAGLKMGGRT